MGIGRCGEGRQKKMGEKEEGVGEESNDMIIVHFFAPPVPHSLAASFPSRAFRNDGLQRRLPVVRINVMSDGRRRCHMRNVELANKLNQTQSNHLCCATGPISYFP